MSLRILGVHGIWNYRPNLTPTEAAAELTTDWYKHLPLDITATADINLRMCYYAHHLHPVTRQAVDDDLDQLPDDAKAILIAWAEQLGALPADVSQAPFSVPARMIVDRIADSRGLSRALVRPFADVFVREVRTYFRTPTTASRTEPQATVKLAIEDHQPHIVIGHSFGSVVAFEALHAEPYTNIDLFITMGSPLGLGGAIYDRLQPAQPEGGPGHRPPGVRYWVNIADPGDIIAVPRPFTKRFEPDRNHEDTHIHWADFHSSGRYLRSRRVAQTIRDYLRGELIDLGPSS